TRSSSPREQTVNHSELRRLPAHSVKPHLTVGGQRRLVACSRRSNVGARFFVPGRRRQRRRAVDAEVARLTGVGRYEVESHRVARDSTTGDARAKAHDADVVEDGEVFQASDGIKLVV